MSAPIGSVQHHRPTPSSAPSTTGLSSPHRIAPDPLRWSAGELALVSLGAALILLISYTFGRGRIFWEDEMLGWMLLHDPSWHHMIRAWKLGADGGGFSFYLTGRAWFALFGSSEASFRLYSGACFAAAFVVVWSAARRFYARGIIAFALINTFFFSPPLVLHMAEGRFYGLLVLSTALAVWVAVLPPRSTRTGTWALCGLTFLVHALLTTSHLLGVAYSLSLVAATIALDWSRHHLRPRFYIAAALSWLLLLPERTAIRASAAVGKPFFWTTQPTFRRFLGAYSAFSAEISVVLLTLVLVFAIALWRKPGASLAHLRAGFQHRRPVYCVTLALLFVPLAFFVEGFFGPALFISRYLLPVCIAQALLTAEALALIPWRSLLPSAFLPPPKPVQILALLLFVSGLLFYNFAFLRPFAIGQIEYTNALSAMLPKGVPVLCEDAWSFTEVIGRQHASGVQYTYLLDWPQSLSPSAPRLEVTQYHLMQNWRSAGYFSSSIRDRDQFLQQYPEFFVLHTIMPGVENVPPEIGNPLLERFQHDPAYTVQLFASLKRTAFVESAWRVCKGTCPSSIPTQHTSGGLTLHAPPAIVAP